MKAYDAKTIINREIKKQIGENIDRLNKNYILRIAYALHTNPKEPWGQKRIEELLERLIPMIDELTKYYQLDTSDDEFLIVKKMEQDGFNIEALYEKAGVPVKWRSTTK